MGGWEMAFCKKLSIYKRPRKKITSYKERRVFQTEMDAAMKIFEQLLKEMKDASREGGPGPD
jgi:selenophosphate synthetase-related protein